MISEETMAAPMRNYLVRRERALERRVAELEQALGWALDRLSAAGYAGAEIEKRATVLRPKL